MKFHLTLFPVILLCTLSCVSHKESLTESYKHNPAKLAELVGTYIVSDSSTYANPMFMFNQEVERDRTTHVGNLLSIDSLSSKTLYSTYFSNGKSEHILLKIKLGKNSIAVRTKWNFRSYVIVSAVGRTKIHLYINENGSIRVTKKNWGIGFFIIFPGFSASEDFQFNYPKLGN